MTKRKIQKQPKSFYRQQNWIFFTWSKSISSLTSLTATQHEAMAQVSRLQRVSDCKRKCCCDYQKQSLFKNSFSLSNVFWVSEKDCTKRLLHKTQTCCQQKLCCVRFLVFPVWKHPRKMIYLAEKRNRQHHQSPLTSIIMTCTLVLQEFDVLIWTSSTLSSDCFWFSALNKQLQNS